MPRRRSLRVMMPSSRRRPLKTAKMQATSSAPALTLPPPPHGALGPGPPVLGPATTRQLPTHSPSRCASASQAAPHVGAAGDPGHRRQPHTVRAARPAPRGTGDPDRSTAPCAPPYRSSKRGRPSLRRRAPGPGPGPGRPGPVRLVASATPSASAAGMGLRHHEARTRYW